MDSEQKRRESLSDHDAMLDAQGQCVPCKLCGGKAVISDAGTGCGYYIACGNTQTFKASKGCLLDQRRLGGWAYNVMEWWNRLHSTAAIAAMQQGEPVAWMYEDEFGSREWFSDRYPTLVAQGWTETPLYALREPTK